MSAEPTHTNGYVSGRPSGSAIRPTSSKGASEPLHRVLELGNRAFTTIGVAFLLAALIHGAVGAPAALASLELLRFTRAVQLKVSQRLADTYEIEEVVPEPVPEPEAPPEPEPEPEPTKAPPPPEAKAAEPPPPPAAAKAGEVLTQEPDPNEPVDMTNSFISVPGGSEFAGGTTQAGGTSNRPVTNGNARAGGVPGGTGTAPAPPAPVGPDRSRAAGLLGSAEWQCPWPEEADSEQIDEADVSVEVMVTAEGKPTGVTVLKDPGHGFGRKARDCAMRKTYATALDRDGKPIAGKTKTVKIHFER